MLYAIKLGKTQKDEKNTIKMKGQSIKAQRQKEHGMFRDAPLAPMQKPQNTHGGALVQGKVGEVESWLCPSG